MPKDWTYAEVLNFFEHQMKLEKRIESRRQQKEMQSILAMKFRASAQEQRYQRFMEQRKKERKK